MNLTIRLLGAIALSCAAPLALASADGQVTFGGATWEVKDGIAYRDGDTLEVTLTDIPFDTAEIAKDGKINSFDALRHAARRNAGIVTLRIGPDGGLQGVDFFRDNQSLSTSGTLDEGFSLDKSANAQARGAYRHQWEKQSLDVRFDLAIQSGELPRPGKPLPADGGAPGKAFLAQIKATHAGDLKTMMKQTHPDRRARVQAMLDGGEGKQMLAMAQAMTPKKVTLKGGRIDGDHALVDFETREDGQTVKGTAELSRVQGVWYLDSISSRN